jgi:hypothetical protein
MPWKFEDSKAAFLSKEEFSERDLELERDAEGVHPSIRLDWRRPPNREGRNT